MGNGSSGGSSEDPSSEEEAGEDRQQHYQVQLLPSRYLRVSAIQPKERIVKALLAEPLWFNPRSTDGAGAVAQRVKALAAFAEDKVSSPSLPQCFNTITPALEVLMPCSDFCGLCTHMLANTHTRKIKIIFKGNKKYLEVRREGLLEILGLLNRAGELGSL